MKNPEVSIILPTHNGARFVEGAIESVLRQTYKDWELIVIDDGSSDNTEEIVERCQGGDDRIRLVKNPTNLGIQKTLNKGLRKARGKYIARIDDDDRWIDKYKLERQIEFLSKHPDYVLVGTGVIVVDERGRELFRFLNVAEDSNIRTTILSRNCFTHSSVVFRKDAVLERGGYDESEAVRHVEDYDLWLALGSRGKFSNLPRYGIAFTLRPDNISSRNKAKQFRKDIHVAHTWRHHYKNYPTAQLRNCARLILYGFFRMIPLTKLKNKILRRYKES